METIKYTIAGQKAEGLLALDNIINVYPGSQEGTCYIKVAGSTAIKADNSVAVIEKRIQDAVKPAPSPTPSPNPTPVPPITVNHDCFNFKTLLYTRLAIWKDGKDAASKAKTEELTTLISMMK
jgi:hypothetical protein